MDQTFIHLFFHCDSTKTPLCYYGSSKAQAFPGEILHKHLQSCGGEACCYRVMNLPFDPVAARLFACLCSSRSVFAF